MLQVARLAPKLLGESRDLVESFIRSQINPDGGFRNRAGDSDLYYTVFGLESLVALQAELPVELSAAYLRTFGTGDGLDFVHRACLVRCWATVARQPDPVIADAILNSIESHRTYDGGYDQSPDAIESSAYAMFVALGAYQDCGRPLPRPHRFADSLDYLPTPDVTPVAAAVATLTRHCERDPDPALARWLLDRHRPEGG